MFAAELFSDIQPLVECYCFFSQKMYYFLAGQQEM